MKKQREFSHGYQREARSPRVKRLRGMRRLFAILVKAWVPIFLALNLNPGLDRYTVRIRLQIEINKSNK